MRISTHRESGGTPHGSKPVRTLTSDGLTLIFDCRSGDGRYAVVELTDADILQAAAEIIELKSNTPEQALRRAAQAN